MFKIPLGVVITISLFVSNIHAADKMGNYFICLDESRYRYLVPEPLTASESEYYRENSASEILHINLKETGLLNKYFSAARNPLGGRITIKIENHPQKTSEEILKGITHTLEDAVKREGRFAKYEKNVSTNGFTVFNSPKWMKRQYIFSDYALQYGDIFKSWVGTCSLAGNRHPGNCYMIDTIHKNLYVEIKYPLHLKFDGSELKNDIFELLKSQVLVKTRSECGTRI